MTRPGGADPVPALEDDGVYATSSELRRHREPGWAGADDSDRHASVVVSGTGRITVFGIGASSTACATRASNSARGASASR